MWSIHTYWFEFSVVSLMFTIGNIVLGHFEEHTPKWRRMVKYLLTMAVVIFLSYFFGRLVSFGLVGLVFLFGVCVHAVILPKKGINGWTAEPKEKYYELRGWDKSKLKKNNYIQQGQSKGGLKCYCECLLYVIGISYYFYDFIIYQYRMNKSIFAATITESAENNKNDFHHTINLHPGRTGGCFQSV